MTRVASISTQSLHRFTFRRKGQVTVGPRQTIKPCSDWSPSCPSSFQAPHQNKTLYDHTQPV